MNLKKIATTLTASSVALSLTFTGSNAIQSAIKRIRDDATKIEKYEANELSLSNALTNAGNTIENLLQFKNTPDELQIANEEAAQLSTVLEETASVEESIPLTDTEVEDLLSKIDVDADIDLEVTKDIIIDKNSDKTLFENDLIKIYYDSDSQKIFVEGGNFIDSDPDNSIYIEARCNSVGLTINSNSGDYINPYPIKIEFRPGDYIYKYVVKCQNSNTILKNITFNITYTE